MRRVENLPLPRSQHKSHSQLPCGISPQSMHRENHPKWKLCRIRNVETALYAIGQTVVLPGPNHHDPRLKPSGKLMIVLQTSVPALWKKKTPPYLCRTTTCPVHELECIQGWVLAVLRIGNEPSVRWKLPAYREAFTANFISWTDSASTEVRRGVSFFKGLELTFVSQS